MKLVSKNNSEELNLILTKYREVLEASSCQFERLMLIQFEINEAEIACMVSDSEGNRKHLKMLNKVLTRLDNRVKLKLVA